MVKIKILAHFHPNGEKTPNHSTEAKATSTSPKNQNKKNLAFPFAIFQCFSLLCAI
jgi:hypothetical protein